MNGMQKSLRPVEINDLVDRLTNGYVGPTRDIYKETGVPYLLAKHVKNNRLEFDHATFISEEFNEKNSKSKLLENDVLLVQTGHIGSSAVVPKLHEGHNCHAMIVITPKHDRVNARYMSYYFNSNYGKQMFQRIQTGATLKHLNCRDVRKLKVPIPTLFEQTRIADILDKAGCIRDKRLSSLVEFDTINSAVFNDMFSAELQNAEWRDLQEYIIELRYGTSKKSEPSGLPVLRIPNVVRSVLDIENLKTVSVGPAELDRIRLKKGDILFVRTNGNPNYVGRSAVFDPVQFQERGMDGQNVVFASYLIRCRLHLDQLRPFFLQTYLQTSTGRRNVREKCRTSAGQYNINTKGLGSLQIPTIDIKKQIEFEKKVESIREARQKYAVAYQESSELFNSLVQSAFKGEL